MACQGRIIGDPANLLIELLTNLILQRLAVEKKRFFGTRKRSSQISFTPWPEEEYCECYRYVPGTAVNRMARSKGREMSGSERNGDHPMIVGLLERLYQQVSWPSRSAPWSSSKCIWM
jgi:hypothetical protein